MLIMSRPFIDFKAKRGRPKKQTLFKAKGKYIQFRLINPNCIELSFPDTKPKQITGRNALRLAYWILDNISGPQTLKGRRY